MPDYFGNLTGANCTLGGQAIISLQATEDIDADYDTASAVCLAPSGPHAKGAIVQTVEGGVSTGYWHIDEARSIRSGERTWRKRSSTGAWGHLPLYAYRLRRKGYLAARSTLTPSNIGGDNFPPKFMPQAEYDSLRMDLFTQLSQGILGYWEYLATLESWRPVGGAADIVRTICGWVGLPVSFACSLPVCAPEYIPTGKPAIAAVREVASWSGASCYLNRSGTLVVYDWLNTYSRGGGTVPRPASVLSEEIQDSVYSANTVTVIGTERYWAATPGTWDPETASFVGGGWGWQTRAVEVTEGIAMATNERPVEERMEIRDYPITVELATKLARERLARIALAAGAGHWRGPAEGSQTITPITSHVFEVSRTLEWTGHGYRYEIEITGPTADISWGGGGGSSWNKGLFF